MTLKGKTTDSLQTKTVEWYKYLLDAQNITDSVAINGKVLWDIFYVIIIERAYLSVFESS